MQIIIYNPICDMIQVFLKLKRVQFIKNLIISVYFEVVHGAIIDKVCDSTVSSRDNLVCCMVDAELVTSSHKKRTL